MLAGASTGLAAPNVFYFGNLIGESGDNPAEAVVNLDDEIASRTHKTGFSPATIINLYDYNRDGRVNATDDLIARHDADAHLQLITGPLSGGQLPAQVTLQPIMLTAGSVSWDFISSPSSGARTQFPDTPHLHGAQVFEPMEFSLNQIKPVLEPVVSNLKSLQKDIDTSIASSPQKSSMQTKIVSNKEFFHDTIFTHLTARNSHAEVDALNDSASQVEVEILLERHLACISDKFVQKLKDAVFSAVATLKY